MDTKTIKCSGACYLPKDAPQYIRRIGKYKNVIFDVSEAQTFGPMFAHEILEHCKKKEIQITFTGLRDWEERFVEALLEN